MTLTEVQASGKTRTIPLWALNALSKRVGTVEGIDRAKVLEERAMRKSAIVYAEGGAFFVTKALLSGPRVVKLDGEALDALADAPVAVVCPSCSAEMRLHNFEAPGAITCANCSTGLEIAKDQSVSKKGPAKGRGRSAPKAPGKKGSKPAKLDSKERVIDSKGVKFLRGDFTAVKGIGAKYNTALHRRGIHTYGDFIKAKPKTIAEVVGISDEQAVAYQKGADLTRVNGLGAKNAELLRAVGVWTLWDLATADAKHVAERVAQLRKSFKMTGPAPQAKQLRTWIGQAKRLV